MAPIKVGFIGLGANGWARGAHTPYLKSGGKYQIVAVQNTSVESARKTIELEGLPAETKAYGSPDGQSMSSFTCFLSRIADSPRRHRK